MDEIDFNTFITIYQKRLNESITQSIALEARVINLNQKIASLTEELESLKSSRSRKKVDEFS
jgi:hypothetical protein